MGDMMQSSVARLVLCILVLSVILPSKAVASEPDELLSREFELVRMTQGPSSFQISLNLSAGEGSSSVEAFVGAFALRTDVDGVVQDVVGLGGSPIGKGTAPGVFINGTEVSTCTVAGLCSVSSTLAYQKFIALEDDGGPNALNRLFIVVEGDARLDISFEADGWVLEEAVLTYRYTDFRASEGAGVVIPGRSADLFLSTQLEGGPLGSIAQAIPPCSTSITGVVSRGVGMMTLTGGQAESSLRCPAVLGDEPELLEDHALHETTWSAEGVVAGDNTLREGRLFAIDLPGCRYLIPGIPGKADDHDCDPM